MPDEPAEHQTDEVAQILCKRWDEAMAAGMSPADAEKFAKTGEIDIGGLRHLVELGCPPELLAQVLL